MVSNSIIDDMIEKAVFDPDLEVRESKQQKIMDLASTQNILPASIQGLYEAMGRGLCGNITVPAINIRSMTYFVARAIFRAALKCRVGAFILEISPKEMVYANQTPVEYSVCVLAAAIKEGFKGPVFIQGDHFQIKNDRFTTDQIDDAEAVKELTRNAISAGFLNIDVDSSTLVDLEKKSLRAQQKNNSIATADMTRFIRNIQPRDVNIAIGGEVGEVGKSNTTVAELKTFMKGYLNQLGTGVKGISKIAVQTGTTHGGVVLPDGSLDKVRLNFKAIEELSRVSREEYGLGGIVQHGASTLPEETFDLFPKAGILEVHLATKFQNLIYDSLFFPKELLTKVDKYLIDNFANERESQDTKEQFLHKNRIRASGNFKRETWHLPKENLIGIMSMLEEHFSSIFQRLNVTDTVDLVKKFTISASGL